MSFPGKGWRVRFPGPFFARFWGPFRTFQLRLQREPQSDSDQQIRSHTASGCRADEHPQALLQKKAELAFLETIKGSHFGGATGLTGGIYLINFSSATLQLNRGE